MPFFAFFAFPEPRGLCPRVLFRIDMGVLSFQKLSQISLQNAGIERREEDVTHDVDLVLSDSSCLSSD